ncbi:MAG: hypothetical protein IPO40_03310 [Fibrobacteres bacterium]|nr:hypothetical protein [Fibrobacterota bacterium]
MHALLFICACLWTSEAPSAHPKPEHGATVEKVGSHQAESSEHDLHADKHEAKKAPPAKEPAEKQEKHPAPKKEDHGAHEASHEGNADSSAPAEGIHPEKAPKHAGHDKPKTEATPDAKTKKAQEGLCGPLARKRTNWTRRDGVLRLRGTVVVGTGQSLSIGPGVEVRVASRDACPDSSAKDGTSIVVLAGGSLMVSGKPQAPVRFTPDSASPKGLSWGGLRLEKTRPAQISLTWAEIHSARTAITFLGGEGEIAHLVVSRCGVGVAILGGGAPSIRHSVFHHNVLADVVSKKSAPHLWGNLFHESQTDGIRFDGVGLARLEGNVFYGQRQNAIVRGPAGAGGWTSDTLPDRFGNWHRDPILRSSDSAQRLMKARQRGLDSAAWWVPRRPLTEPPGTGPWALSAHSPLLDKGPRLCKDVDGTTCDIGLWGGK